MAQRIESMTGNGTATRSDGQQVSVKYDLGVYQDEIRAGHLEDSHASVQGLKEIRGRVKPVCFFGETVTLKMQDGRKLEFFFTDTEGNIALRRWIG